MVNEDILKDILGTVASICTVLQFLSGTIICQKIRKNESTGDMSSFPFVIGFLSTCLWLKYGILISDPSIIIVNMIGALLFFSYVVVFTIYSIRKVKIQVIRQILFCMAVISLTLLKIAQAENVAEARSFLGRVCMVVTLLFFAAPFTSLLHVIKMKSSESLPYHLIVSTFIVSLEWFIYGCLLEDNFIQIPNFIGCVLSGIQLSLFLIFPSKLDAKIHSVNEI